MTQRELPGARASSRDLPWILLLVVAGFALRWFHLGHHSLWLDEALTWWNVTRPTWAGTALAEVNHGPVWWLATRPFVEIFGDREWALRAPAALLGGLSVFLCWHFARALLDPERVPRAAGFRGVDARAPLWVAAAAAVHPFWIEYAQEARMYSAVLVLSLALSLLYLRWLRLRDQKSLAAYAVLATIGIYTQYVTILVPAAHAAFALIAPRLARRGEERLPSPGPLLLTIAAAVAAGLPWVVRSLQSGGVAPSIGAFAPLQRLALAEWRLLLGPSWASTDRLRIDAGTVALARAEWPIFLAGGLLVGGALLLGIRALRRDPLALLFLLAAAGVPALALFAVYSWVPTLHEKYLIATAPPLLVLVVTGAHSLGRGLGTAWLAALMGLFLAGTVAYFRPDLPLASRWVAHGHPTGKENWRAARAWVAERADTGDVVLVYPGYARIPWEYYDRGRLPMVAMRALPRPADRTTFARAGGSTFLVTGALRAEMRDSLLAGMAPGREGTSAKPSEEVLFPTHWGVWVYRFDAPRSAAGGDSGTRLPTR